MKNDISHSSSGSVRHWRPRSFGLKLIAVAGCLAVTAATLRAQENQLEVDVRPFVTDKSVMWSNKPKVPGDGGHGRVYGIAMVAEIKNDQLLASPVNEDALVSLVLNELDKNGFREFKAAEKPDILLTVSYGRGELPNPYIRDQGERAGGEEAPQFAGITEDSGNAVVEKMSMGNGHANDTGVTGVTITGAAAHQLFDEKGHGYEARMQKAGFEQLYIRITAWQYPSGPKAKPRMLWKTIMCVDDPDHRDLNAIAASMLEAGAPYFDKVIRDREAIIFKPLSEGRVNVGTPEVVDKTKK